MFEIYDSIKKSCWSIRCGLIRDFPLKKFLSFKCSLGWMQKRIGSKYPYRGAEQPFNALDRHNRLRGSTCAHRAACLTEILAFLRSFLSCLRCLSFITACTWLVWSLRLANDGEWRNYEHCSYRSQCLYPRLGVALNACAKGWACHSSFLESCGGQCIPLPVSALSHFLRR